MKRIYVPTRSGSEWQRLLARPKLQWKTGASAMTAAASWEAAADSLPPEIATALDSTGEPELASLKLLAAIPEWKVELPGGDRPSATDVLAICRNEISLCTLAVEAKVLEDFGPTVSQKRESPSEDQTDRLNFLHALLKVKYFSDGIRYQLLHRTASALLTAKEFHAGAAVMLIQAFDTPNDRREDFTNFCREMGTVQVGPDVHKIPGFSGPNLYLAWCNGNPKYRLVKYEGVV